MRTQCFFVPTLTTLSCPILSFRSVRKATLLFLLFAVIGALALILYPLLLLGTPTTFICNLRNWFSNGGLIMILGYVFSDSGAFLASFCCHNKTSFA